VIGFLEDGGGAMAGDGVGGMGAAATGEFVAVVDTAVDGTGADAGVVVDGAVVGAVVDGAIAAPAAARLPSSCANSSRRSPSSRPLEVNNWYPEREAIGSGYHAVTFVVTWTTDPPEAVAVT
jgi:hypothetical protein